MHVSNACCYPITSACSKTNLLDACKHLFTRRTGKFEGESVFQAEEAPINPTLVSASI